ncbi:MAG: Fic family protein [Prevotella sp.]|nr:Fic family protein [Prevotella sp.]
MFEQELLKYDELVQRYQEEIVAPMEPASYNKYAEILFSCHSCGIEGNSFTVDDTRALFEQQLGFYPVGRTLFECQEMADHFKAYEYTFSDLERNLDEGFIKEINRLVTQNTLSYKYPDTHPGYYTTVDMAAGDTVFGNHDKLIQRLPSLLHSTNEAIYNRSSHPLLISARFHGYFVYLHPFRDGNGRTARLLSNWILAKFGYPLMIIRREEREEYISALRSIRKEGTDEHLLSFFLKTATHKLESAIQQKKKNSKSLSFIFL